MRACRGSGFGRMLPVRHSQAARRRPHVGPGRMSSKRRLPFGALGPIAFVVVLVGVPLFAPQFWVTLGNYVGLYSIVALGLVLLTGRGGADVVRAGGVRRSSVPTRPPICAPQYATSPWINLLIGLALTLALALFLGVHHAAHEGPLPAARDDRVGHQPLSPVRQPRVPRRPHRDSPASLRWGSSDSSCATSATYYFLIWGIAIAALWATNNLLDSRPGRAIRALRGQIEMAEAFGVERRAAQDRRLRLRGAARVRLGLALRAPAALRQSDAVRHQPGHRIPVHGGRRRRRQRMGRGHRRDAHHAGEAGAAGRSADAARQERQLRDRGVRRADDRAAAARAGGRLAVDRAPAAAARAAARSRRGAAAARAKAAPAGALLEVRVGAQAVRRPRRGQRPVVRDASPARSSGSSDRTAPARARCSTSSPVRSRSPRETSSFAGASIVGCKPVRDRPPGHRPHVPARASSCRG